MWRRLARVAIAAAGIGTAAAIFVFTRPRPTPAPKLDTASIDPGTAVQTGAGTVKRYDGDRLVGTLTYSAVREFQDGRTQWTGFRYAFADGAVTSADTVEAKGTAASGDRPMEGTATGHFQWKTRDGTTLASDRGTFNDSTGVATMPGATAFTHGHTSGSGTGGVFQQKTNTFTLQADVHITLTPNDAAISPVDITSQSMVYVTDTKTLTFDGAARLVRAAETMSADQAIVHLSEDEQRFTAIEMRGRSAVVPAAGKASDLPEMRAADIDLTFYPDSSALQHAQLRDQAVMVMTNDAGRRSIQGSTITFATAADGKTLTRVEAKEHAIVKTPGSQTAPERSISAAYFLADGTEKEGLTASRFDGSVEFVEMVPGQKGQPDHRRVSNAESLTAKLIAGQLDAIQDARFERNVQFKDGDVSGYADVGVYHASKGGLDLLPNGRAGKRPHASDGTIAVDASESIHVNMDSNDLEAHGSVNTLSKGRARDPKSPAASPIFNGTDPLNGSAADFTYAAAAHKARYVGAPGAPAWLKQGDNKVSGDDVSFNDATQDLTAKGHVDSNFAITSPDAAHATDRYRVSADSLTYSDAKRTATYEGAPAVLVREEGETRARTLVITLAKDSNTLAGLDAVGAVEMTMTEGRRVTADSVQHQAARDLYVLQGQPVTVWSRESDNSCTKSWGNYAEFDTANSLMSFPPSRNVGSSSQAGLPCPKDVPATPRKK